MSSMSSSHTFLGSESSTHNSRARPNSTKGETLVELYDDAYYFWHPGSETFLTPGPEYHVIGSPTAVKHWELRHSLSKGGPDGYYVLWSQDLDGKRKKVLDLFGASISSGTRVGYWEKHEGGHQKWVLRSDGDEDG